MGTPVTVQATAENLQKVLGIVRETAKQCGFSDERSNEAQVAAEEAFVNIVRYAYESGGECTVDCSADETTLTLTLSDSGIAFDPTAAPKPDTESDVSDRPIGGLGILLIRKFMDDVSYSREDGTNTLIMKAGPRENEGSPS